MRPRTRLVVPLAVAMLTSLFAGGSAGRAPAVAAGSPPATVSPPARPPSPVPSPSSEKTASPSPRPRPLDRKGLTRAIDRYLRGRPLALVMVDRTTGVAYRYHSGRRFVTASCAKVDILMTLLLQRQKRHRRISAEERALARPAIRYSDNKATDRLWERVGGPTGVTAANRAFGLRDTRAVGGRCLDLYCWGITDTTADQQVRLLANLVDADSPLSPANRAYVLRLMGDVADEQAWGVSAAARRGDRVELKNGWQRRLSHGELWAINSIGRVRSGGHDWLIAVLSDHHPTSGTGIAVVEHVVRLAAREFRRTTAP